MKDKRFETYEVTKESRPPTENCSTCENYYTGACDGLRGYCSSYKQYRAKTIEDLVKIAIGAITLFGVAIFLLQIATAIILR